MKFYVKIIRKTGEEHKVGPFARREDAIHRMYRISKKPSVMETEIVEEEEDGVEQD